MVFVDRSTGNHALTDSNFTAFFTVIDDYIPMISENYRFLCCLLIWSGALSLSVGEEHDFYGLEYSSELPNHLTPVDYSPEGYSTKSIDKLLFLTDTIICIGRFVCRPSFNPDTCVSVHRQIPKSLENRKNDVDDPFGGESVPDNEWTYFITYTRASEKRASSTDGNKPIKVVRTDREISFELAVAIQRVWAKALCLTRHPANAIGMTDGTTYQFTAFVGGLGDISGETWSPRRGLPAELVSIGNALAEFVGKKDAKEKPLIERLKAFEAKIPKH